MTLASILVLAEAEAEAAHGNIFLDTAIYPIIAIIGFVALALVTLSYRNVANRHPRKAEAYAREHADELQAGHGH